MSAQNAKPATVGWLIRRPNQYAIAGYADDVSYVPGDTVTLYVDSHTSNFTYEVFRMGWYDGGGGRGVLPRTPPLQNPRQPRPTVADDRDYGAKLLRTGWHPSAQFDIPDDWVSGVYLVKLANVRNRGQSYATFVVRAPKRTAAPVVVVLPTNTWQAYNDWGGLSLYRDNRSPRFGHRTTARKVSFLRPYSSGYGAGLYFFGIRPVVEFLESRGYDVSYATDRDAQEARIAGPSTRLLIFPNHTEYNARVELAYYKRLVKQGVSIAVFGGNTFVWRTHFSHHGRIEAVYRDPGARDPDGDPEPQTRWEWLGWNPNQLIGAMQVWPAAPGKRPGPLVAVATNHWAWAGAGVAPGRPVGRVQGVEYDGIVLNRTTPRGLIVLARSRVPSLSSVPRFMDMTILPERGGGFVFDGSDTGFPWNLSYPSYQGLYPPKWIGQHAYPHHSRASRAIQRLVDNLIVAAEGGRPKRMAPAKHHRSTPLRVLSPLAGQPLPVGMRNVVVWTGGPSASRRVKVTLDGRAVGMRPAWTSTFTGRGLATAGPHVIGVTAVSASGRTVASRRIPVVGVPASSSIFQAGGGLPPAWSPRWQLHHPLWRAWA